MHRASRSADPQVSRSVRSAARLTLEQAANAIYVDFECLKGRPPDRPQPKLLGVLLGADGEQIQQLVLDDRLAPVARVNRRTEVIPVSDAVGAIVAAASVDDRPIIGWSFFDRERMIDARPDLASDIRARYVNAIQIARPWRQNIYPEFKIERDDDFAPKHTLDKYARLAGYPGAKALVDATPAKWIRDVLKQLESASTRARKSAAHNNRRQPVLAERSKTTWRRLLKYNRHDLLALRHIVLRATREAALWRAYERTRFCVDDGHRRICFMAGSRNRSFDALLVRHHARRWAFITAWNPGSINLPREQNDARQAQLRHAVAEYESLPGEGIGPAEAIGNEPRWPPEESLLVLNISRGKAASLGRRFGQFAIVVGRRGEKSELLPTGSATTSTPLAARATGSGDRPGPSSIAYRS